MRSGFENHVGLPNGRFFGRYDPELRPSVLPRSVFETRNAYNSKREVVKFVDFTIGRGVPFSGDSVMAAYVDWLDSLAFRGPTVARAGRYGLLVFSGDPDSPFPLRHPAVQTDARNTGKRPTRQAQWPHLSSYLNWDVLSRITKLTKG